jgi:hypothetical protein
VGIGLVLGDPIVGVQSLGRWRVGVVGFEGGNVD